MLPLPLLLRLAARLQSAWAGRGGPPDDDPADFEARVAAVRRAGRRLRFARDRSLTLVAPRLQRELLRELEDLRRCVEGLRLDCAVPLPPPDLADWLAELRQLDDEFDGLEVDWKGSLLRAVTEPIVLKGVDLGRFALELPWKEIGSNPGPGLIAVRALEPHCASGKPDVTHPHVRDERICPGDAQSPVERALAAGRLGDAFVLLRSVLRTYNPRSPFVPLDEWESTPCSDCGRRRDPDERYSCSACDSDLCGECSRCCAGCESERCGECLETCAVCLDSCCPNCLEEVAPDRMLCPACLGICAGRSPRRTLDNPRRLCPDCLTEDSHDDTDDESDADAEDDAPTAIPAVPGSRLAVPAG